MPEPEIHYVAHLRIEKVTKSIVATRGVVSGNTTTEQNREVEDVLSATRKSSDLSTIADFIRGNLDLVVDDE